MKHLDSEKIFDAKVDSLPLLSNARIDRTHFEQSRISSDFHVCTTPSQLIRFCQQRSLLPTKLAAFLSPIAPEVGSSTKCYLHYSGMGGYGITEIGELVSVFSLPGHGLGRAILVDAVNRGAHFLECFDGKLPHFYAQVGFVVSGRKKWNDKYAPIDWKYDLFGRPDVVRMELAQV